MTSVSGDYVALLYDVHVPKFTFNVVFYLALSVSFECEIQINKASVMADISHSFHIESCIASLYWMKLFRMIRATQLTVVDKRNILQRTTLHYVTISDRYCTCRFLQGLRMHCIGLLLMSFQQPCIELEGNSVMSSFFTIDASMVVLRATVLTDCELLQSIVLPRGLFA